MSSSLLRTSSTILSAHSLDRTNAGHDAVNCFKAALTLSHLCSCKGAALRSMVKRSLFSYFFNSVRKLDGPAIVTQIADWNRCGTSTLHCCAAQRKKSSTTWWRVSIAVHQSTWALTAYSKVLNDVWPAPNRNRCMCVSIVSAGVVSGWIKLSKKQRTLLPLGLPRHPAEVKRLLASSKLR